MDEKKQEAGRSKDALAAVECCVICNEFFPLAELVQLVSGDNPIYICEACRKEVRSMILEDGADG